MIMHQDINQLDIMTYNKQNHSYYAHYLSSLGTLNHKSTIYSDLIFLSTLITQYNVPVPAIKHWISTVKDAFIVTSNIRSNRYLATHSSQTGIYFKPGACYKANAWWGTSIDMLPPFALLQLLSYQHVHQSLCELELIPNVLMRLSTSYLLKSLLNTKNQCDRKVN